MATPRDLALAHVRDLHAYVPGAQPQGGGWVKLNTNELPFPPSPAVVEAVAAEASKVALYPSPTSAGLRQALAARHGVDPAQVLVGNGSDDVLNLLVRVFSDRSHPVGWTVPSYSLYPVLAGIQGSPLLDVPLGEGWTLPVDAIVACPANLFFLTAPNAPSGVLFPEASLRAVADRFPGILVIDEAYADFAGWSAIPLLADHPRLVVTRTFSKSMGMAGLRVGYAVASAETIGLLDRVRDSYNLDRLAQAGALAGLGDRAYYDRCVATVVATRERVAGVLRGWGWDLPPSRANFLLAEPVDAAGRRGPEVARSAFDSLLADKVLVRYFPNHPLTASRLRVSVGTDAEMDTLLHSLDRWRTRARP